jgi:SET domain-containing protein
MKKKIINSILKNCNVRLKPSTICDGVGVFCIKPIKMGEVLFTDVKPDTIYIKFTELVGIDDTILNYLKSMCNSDNDGIYLSRTINNINITYFINHSNNPNVEHDLTMDVYKAIRDINVGEEILCTYNEQEQIGF